MQQTRKGWATDNFCHEWLTVNHYIMLHPYISHLLADIAGAHQQQDKEACYSHSIEAELQQVESLFGTGELLHSFGDYCGLSREQFPPREQLSIEDMVTVCKAFQQMMWSWNLEIQYPENLPTERLYELVLGMLDEKTIIPKMGFMCFVSCTGYPPDCVFKEYCKCKLAGREF